MAGSVLKDMTEKIVDNSSSTANYLTQSQPFVWNSPWLLVIGLLVIIILWRLLRKKKPQRNNIFIVGDRNSGKTKLFCRLTNGKEYQTVPSCVNNKTEIEVAGRRKLLIDVTGDNHSKE